MSLLERPAWRTGAIAALLLVGVFGVYGLLSPPGFDGYEGETAGVAEGIARGQGTTVPVDTELDPASAGQKGRTGILQPLLMVPFYGAGSALDSAVSGGEDHTYRAFLLRLYSAFVTALCAAMLFLLVRVLGRSEGWAMVISLLFAFASIALPYAGIGMEPTGTLVVMLSFLAAACAARTGNPWLWALTGVAIGLAASTRPSNAVPALGALVLLWPRLRDAGAPERRRLVFALALPFVVGGTAFIAYNLHRYDKPFETGYEGIDYSLGAVPSAAVGLFLSPGKGLAWYSPLVILGFLGLLTMWRRERILALAIVAGVALGAMPYLIAFWSDETWGPRYLVPVAWLLLLPIAWWATTRTRQLVLAAVTVVAVWVQLAGGLTDYRFHLTALSSGELTGAKVYGQVVQVPDEQIPYGDDPVRWVPELSPLVFHSEALIAIAARNAGLPSPEAEYAPFRGRKASVDISQTPVDLWWNPGSTRPARIPRPSALWVIPLGLLAAGGAGGLMALGAGRREQEATSA